MLNLTRDGEVTDFRRFPTEGVDTTRFSLDTGWQRTLYSDSGFVTDVTGAVRGDLYWSNDLPESSTSTEVEDGVTAGRFYPRATVTTRYPFVGQWGTVQPLAEQIGRAACRESVCQYV